MATPQSKNTKPAEEKATQTAEESLSKVEEVGEAVPASAYVPVFLDEEGEQIPRNSILRVCTTEKVAGNLRALDGTLITPEPVAELHGPDLRDGDWFTTQFRAGFLRVHSVKKIR